MVHQVFAQLDELYVLSKNLYNSEVVATPVEVEQIPYDTQWILSKFSNRTIKGFQLTKPIASMLKMSFLKTPLTSFGV